jgi:hypothetical protein
MFGAKPLSSPPGFYDHLVHRIAAIISFLLFPLSACGESESTTPQEQQAHVDSTQLLNAMVASYPGLDITYSDAQDDYQRLEDRLLGGRQPWPTIGTDCLKRLSPGGHVRILGETGSQAPAALRAWGTELNDTAFEQVLVALPDNGAEAVVRSPLPKKCLSFKAGEPDSQLRWTVRDRSLPLGDVGRMVDVEAVSGRTKSRSSTVLFAYKGVLAIIKNVKESSSDFPERALKRMEEQL